MTTPRPAPAPSTAARSLRPLAALHSLAASHSLAAGLALLALCGGCAGGRAHESHALWSDSAGSIADPALARLCEDVWEHQLERDPVAASRLGDERFLGELPDLSFGAEQRHERTLERFVQRIEGLALARLSNQELLTLHELHRRLSVELALLRTGVDFPSWNLDPRGGVQVDFLSLAPEQPLATRAQREAMLARWAAMPRAIERQVENLRRGLGAGRVACRAEVEHALAQLDELLATPVEDSPLARPGVPEGTPPGSDAFGADMDARVRTLALVRNEIYPAFERYRRVLREELLPRARVDAKPGVMHVEGGSAAYRVAIEQYTSLALSPEEIHAYGKAEIARLRGEMEALGRDALGCADLPALQRRLREDPALHFHDAAEVLERARLTLARAQAALPRAFGRLPRTPCEVVPVPEHEAPHTTIAYYQEPSADGGKPGRYFVNAWAPETRPTYEAEALAFHESVPGHHLQIALAHELEGLPLVRRHSPEAAFVEGWALYTERLADELGLYTGPLDRLGMLSFDAWRAARLVVDTGLHALGWTRAQAIGYMLDNTLLAPNNVENEVDRYIAWPGQALAYKLGQREILALRQQAQQSLGERFSLADFHDRLLENGPISLAALRDAIESWLRRASARS